VDLGVWMSPEVLEHKLEAREEKNREFTWNVARLPVEFTSSNERKRRRLFVASKGAWRGWFALADEVLWNPEDVRAPFALIADAGTWTPIAPVRVGRFPGVRALPLPPTNETNAPRGTKDNQNEAEGDAPPSGSA
jgi:hypothetical protein